jgi:hypothetical protein
MGAGLVRGMHRGMLVKDVLCFLVIAKDVLFLQAIQNQQVT